MASVADSLSTVWYGGALPLISVYGAGGARQRDRRSGIGGSHRLSVLIVLPGLGAGGGAERSLLAVAPAMVERGMELHVAVLTDRQTLVPELERRWVRIHDLSTHRSVVGRARALRSLVRSIRPALIHATLFDATLPAQLAAVGSNVPLLVTWATTDYVPERRQEHGGQPWTLPAYRLIDTVLGRMSGAWYHAVTEGVAVHNARALRVPSARVLVGERGRDSVSGPANDEASATFLPTGAKLILAVGRQEPVKGYDLLLEAFEQIAVRFPDAYLAVAGREGRATERLMTLRSRLPHGDRITFLGQRSDVQSLLREASVLVCSSWREGAAGAVIEAMGAGTPVVSVPIAGLEGVTLDGENALVVPRESLAEGIGSVLGDRELAERLVAGGRRTFQSRFTTDVAADRMAEIYRSVAATCGTSPPRCSDDA